jgi:hypothetical protein
MCYFVTVAVPETHAERLENSVPRDLAAHPVMNASIARHLPPKYRSYVLTTGMCSCDLFFSESPIRHNGAHADKLRQKYEKRGWSKAKIDRALAQASPKRASESTVGLRQDLRELLATVVEETGELGIVAHWYHGDIEAESFSVSIGPIVTPESLRTGEPPMSEDQIVFVRR